MTLDFSTDLPILIFSVYVVHCQMPFAMQGGDVTHDLYKWQRNAIASDNARLKRSKSAGELSAMGNESASMMNADDGNGSIPAEEEDPALDIKRIRTPGGFRRNFLLRQHVTFDNGSTSASSAAPKRPGMQRATSSCVASFHRM